MIVNTFHSSPSALISNLFTLLAFPQNLLSYTMASSPITRSWRNTWQVLLLSLIQTINLKSFLYLIQILFFFRLVCSCEWLIYFMFLLPQITKGYEFESETDTEVIPKLIKYVYDNREDDIITFSTLVERVVQQLASSSHTFTVKRKENTSWSERGSPWIISNVQQGADFRKSNHIFWFNYIIVKHFPRQFMLSIAAGYGLIQSTINDEAGNASGRLFLVIGLTVSQLDPPHRSSPAPAKPPNPKPGRESTLNNGGCHSCLHFLYTVYALTPTFHFMTCCL